MASSDLSSRSSSSGSDEEELDIDEILDEDVHGMIKVKYRANRHGRRLSDDWMNPEFATQEVQAQWATQQAGGSGTESQDEESDEQVGDTPPDRARSESFPSTPPHAAQVRLPGYSVSSMTLKNPLAVCFQWEIYRADCL